MRGGSQPSASSRTRFPSSCAAPGSGPRRPESSAASAPSCAARRTASCRAWGERCREGDGFMRVVVRVVSQEDYSKWVGDKKQALVGQADDPGKKLSLEDLK